MGRPQISHIITLIAGSSANLGVWNVYMSMNVSNIEPLVDMKDEDPSTSKKLPADALDIAIVQAPSFQASISEL